jgi:hypothetical protein
MNNRTKITITVTALLVVLIVAVGALYINGKSGSGKTEQTSTSTTPLQTAEQTSTASSSAIASQTESTDTAADSTEASDSTVKEQVPQSNGLQLSPPIEEVKVKAVYLTGPSAGSSARVDKIINMAKTTELNTVVVDIKEDGAVNFKTSLDVVNKYGKQLNYYKPKEVIKKFHDNGVYVIGRIVVFKDPVLAKSRADLGVKMPSGKLWLENGQTPWANPYMEEVWDYNIAIAKEAISYGFDEIQFDYVRFPTGSKSSFNYGANAPVKAEAINGFLAKAEKELHQGLGVPVSADVFAIIIESKGDGESIGQRINEVGKDIYCISPMIYPSHYANNSPKGIMGNGVGQKINGVTYTKPDLDPYGVVYNSLLSARKKISEVPGYKAKVRPYIQAFTAKYLPAGYFQTYGAEQVRQQIKAIQDAGYEEWILWDPSNKYQESYFEKEK